MKSNKIASNSVFAAAAILAVFGLVAKVDPPLEDQNAIFAPKTVEVGELVVLNVQGKDVKWSILPEVAYQSFDDSFLATSFPSPGQYSVTAAYTDGDGGVHMDVVVITVGSPTPETTPEPTPDPFSNTKFPTVAETVRLAATANSMDKASACLVGNNFETVANDIAAGKYIVPISILRATATANSGVGVTQTSSTIQYVISEAKFKGELATVGDYEDLWRQIAAGLKSYGEC